MHSIALKKSNVLALKAFVIAGRTTATRCASTSTAKLVPVCRPSSSSRLILSKPQPHITMTRNTPSNLRAFTFSSIKANSSSSSSNTTGEEETLLQSKLPNLVFPDPHRPDLFYHLVPPPTPLSRTHPAYALSFLGEEVALHSGLGDGESPAVIGWLPAAQEGGGETTLSDFVHNGMSYTCV